MLIRGGGDKCRKYGIQFLYCKFTALNCAQTLTSVVFTKQNLALISNHEQWKSMFDNNNNNHNNVFVFSKLSKESESVKPSEKKVGSDF